MAGTAISFDGNNLQTANIFTADIVHEQYPDKYAPVYPIAHENKSNIPFMDYPSKTITIRGKVTDTSAVALDSTLDTFRSYFRGKDKNLDIGYGSGTRRYTATATAIGIDRPGGLNFANFEISFTATLPFGSDTSSTTALNQTGRTSSIYASDSHSFLGTAPVQLPVFTVSLTSTSTSTTNQVTNPGFETDTTGWSSGGVGSFARTTSQFHSGVASLQVTNAGSPSGGNYAWAVYLATTTVGASYNLTCWVKGNAGGELLTIGIPGKTTNITLTTSWQQVVLSFTASSTTTELDFISTSPSAGVWFLDDVSLIQNTSASITIGNAGNGQAVTVTRVWAAADILVVDCLNKTVQVNGADVNFSGAFPEFPRIRNPDLPGYLYYPDLFRNCYL